MSISVYVNCIEQLGLFWSGLMGVSHSQTWETPIAYLFNGTDFITPLVMANEAVGLNQFEY